MKLFMMSAALQRSLNRLSQVLLVLLLAGLPLLPPIMRGGGLDARFWLSNLTLMAALVALYYLNLLVAVPRLLFRGHWFRYLLVLAVLAAALLPLRTHFAVRPADPPGGPPGPGRPGPGPGGAGPPMDYHPAPLVLGPLKFDDSPRPPRRDGNDAAAVFLLSTALVIGGGTMRAINRRGQEEAERRRVAETERLETELAYLRTQLNPHVFFNTLNSIYVLTELNVAQARQAIIRLSRLMRYLLHQNHEASVPLRQEVTFLEDYIGLMKLRLTPNMQVDFEYDEQLRDAMVAPMLLQPFVENAFKYGVSTSQPATIFIGLSLADGKLQFEVRNQVFATPQVGFAMGSGIGLANTRRRLELLYPGRHQLLVTESPAANEFAIHLTLSLT